MSTPKVNQSSVSKGIELQFDMILAGLQALPPTTQLSVQNNTYTPATLSTLVNQENAINKTVRTLRLQLQQAVATRRGQKLADRKLVTAIRSAVIGLLGDDSSDLVKFGFKPRKPHTATVEEKALAVARGKETREARGTKGPRAKEAIQGDKPASVTVMASGGIVVPPTPPPPTTK
ncbi:MAG TPA: hypothetical protein VFF73_15215 [Planctomycetota bacterium]|nr:hypothetical protein [Planctomycetota bacterium]